MDFLTSWWSAEQRAREKRSGKAVPFGALPADARAALIALLKRGDDVGPAARSLDTDRTKALFAAAIAAFMLVMVVPVAITFAPLGGPMTLLTFTLPVFLLAGWPVMVVLRFVWERTIAWAPPGAYLFATGLIEVSRGGLVRFVPAPELQLTKTRHVRQLRRGSSSTTATVHIDVKSSVGEQWTFVVSSGWVTTLEHESERLSRQETRLGQLQASGDVATLAIENPFAWARRPEVWPTLSPDMPAQGGRLRAVPRILYGHVVGAAIFQVLLAGLLSPCICSYAALQWADESDGGAFYDCSPAPDCMRGVELCARNEQGEARCMRPPAGCDVSCACLTSVYPGAYCTDAGEGAVVLFPPTR